MAKPKDDKKPKKSEDKNKPGDGSQPKPSDNSKDDDKDKNLTVPKHRFDEVSKELKELRTWKEEQEKAKADAEEKKLKDEKKFEELLEKKEKELADVKTKFEKSTIDNKIQAAAVKAGIKDVDAALKLIDRDNIKVSEEGEVEGLDEAVTGLVEARPYLKDAEAEPSLGSGTTPSGEGTGTGKFKRFKLSDIQNPEFYKEHEEEIDKAMTIPGAITDDVGVTQQPQAQQPQS